MNDRSRACLAVRPLIVTGCALALAGCIAATGRSAEQATAAEPLWTIFIANDNCPDYTWGLTEAQTRQAFADIVKAHLDEMARTDQQPPENRNRYNAAVTQELLCFVEKYPQRKQELIERIKQGRLYVSPYLCNSLWAFQDNEGLLRTFYPARRLERDWAVPKIDCAHHIELPSLPWGHATLLAGCGIKYLSLPYLAYDSTFNSFKVPPLFYHEGPDGSRVMVWLDVHASSKAGYTQGADVLRSGDALDRQWLAHYSRLGTAYPLRALLASGTHGDISPSSGNQARQFAEQIIRYNARADRKAKLVNATFPMFWQAVEQQQAKTPWLQSFRGDFGHSWDLWPVSLAKYAAAMRNAQRDFLAAEALLSIAGYKKPALIRETLPDRIRAEWCWAMLSDHAWNGTGEENQRHNAQLRRDWARELASRAEKLTALGWQTLGAAESPSGLLLFNPLGFPRKSLVCLSVEQPQQTTVKHQNKPLPAQVLDTSSGKLLCFVSPEVPAFGLAALQLERLKTPTVQGDAPTAQDKAPTLQDKAPTAQGSPLRASPDVLEGPFYRATVDRRSGGLSSLIHKPTGAELVAPPRQGQPQRRLCQSVYFDGKQHTMTDVETEVVACGPVLARLKISGKLDQMHIVTYVTVYAELDQVDFELHVHKPPTSKENRLCQVFPLMAEGATLRIATTGAVIRPAVQPDGDLLPGADTRRFAVQEYVDCSTEQLGVTLALMDPFVLRMDLEPLSIESIGNDQNYKEVTKDQNGETDFQIRYSLQARKGGYDGPAAMTFARAAAAPLLTFRGRLPEGTVLPSVAVDPRRAVATCFKPADDPVAGGFILRLWETAGHSGPIDLVVSGYRKAIQTDLLERDIQPLPVEDGRVRLELKAHGFAALRLLP